MSNKMKKYFFLVLMLIISALLQCYEPGQGDFFNPYQYGLYLSWQQKSKCRVDAPTAFTSTKITKLFNIAGREIKVEYDWTNFKITNQREVITGYQYKLKKEIREYLGSFLYRFNCADSEFVQNFLKDTGSEIIYSVGDRSAGFELLWEQKGTNRINFYDILNIELNKTENSVTLHLSDFKLKFILQDLKIDLSLLIGPESSYKIDFPAEKEIGEKPSGITVKLPEKMSLKEYISRNYQRKQSREMLHNKIRKVEDFLKTEFPHHEISHENNTYLINSHQFQDFHDHIAVNSSRQEDGISISPENSYQIRGKEFHISNEIIDLSKLDQEEINSLAPYLPQLLYEHRSIGTRLLDFLLIHDNVPTTLLLKTDERQKFEIASYADLLLMLNKYWEDRKIYFKINDFRKVNNYIEFKGFLLAVKEDLQSADSAEIWFHLDKDFRIDLIMMMLYPEVKL